MPGTQIPKSGLHSVICFATRHMVAIQLHLRCPHFSGGRICIHWTYIKWAVQMSTFCSAAQKASPQHIIGKYCNTQTTQFPPVHFKVSDHGLRNKR